MNEVLNTIIKRLQSELQGIILDLDWHHKRWRKLEHSAIEIKELIADLEQIKANK